VLALLHQHCGQQSEAEWAALVDPLDLVPLPQTGNGIRECALRNQSRSAQEAWL
jgi:hypothetical protein